MSRRTTELLLLIAAAFPVTLLYALYVANTGTAITFSTLAVPLGLFAAFAAAHIAVRLLAPGADPAILPIVFVLSGIGITFVTRLAPDLAMNQLVYLFVSIALMVATLAAVRNLDVVARYKYTFGIAGIVLLILPIFIGTEQGGSKLWINFFGLFTIQPGEFAKVFIVLFLAGYLAENRELLSIAKVGIVESDDFVYIYSLEELTQEIFERCCTEALTDGLKRVDPNPNHNFSLVSIFFLCDTITPEGSAALKKMKYHKDSEKPQHGWVDLRLAAVEVGSNSRAANPMGKVLLNIYKASVN